MPVITIDGSEIKKGWAQDFFGTPAGGVEASKGYYSRSSQMDPFRQGFLGHLTPGGLFTALTDASTKVNALPLNGVVDSSGEAFCILSNARVVQFGVIDDVVDAHNATAHGAHASLSGEDILAYRTSSDEYVIYSFNDGTDADVGRRTKSTAGYDDDWLSTVPTQVNGTTLTKGVPHKMKIGPDGNIHITNGQYIATFDIAANSVNYQRLNLGAGFVATSLDIDLYHLVIVGYQSTSYITSFSKAESRCWFWNTTSPFYQAVYDLHDNYVSAIYSRGGYLYAFTNGRNSTTKIQVLNGNQFDVAFESALIGSPPRHASIEDHQGLMNFVGSGGSSMYAMDGKSFHHRTNTIDSGLAVAVDIGMVKNLSQNVLYMGRTKSGGSTYDIIKSTTGYTTNADFRSRIYRLPRKSRITKVIPYFSQWGTGAAIAITICRNYETLSGGGGTDLFNKTYTYAESGAVSSISKTATKAVDIDSFILYLRWQHANTTDTAAYIRSIDVVWEPTEKP